jgi:hypothetical protein
MTGFASWPRCAHVVEGGPTAALSALSTLLERRARGELDVVVLEAALATRQSPELSWFGGGSSPSGPPNRPPRATPPAPAAPASPFRILPSVSSPQPAEAPLDPVEAVASLLGEATDPPVVLGPEARLVRGDPAARVVIFGALGAASHAVLETLPPSRFTVDAGRDSFGGLAGLIALLSRADLAGVELVLLLGLRPDDAALGSLMRLTEGLPRLAWEPAPEAAVAWATLSVPTTGSLAVAARCAHLRAARLTSPASAFLIATSPALASLAALSLADGPEAPLRLLPPSPALVSALAEHLPASLEPANPLLLQPVKATSAALPPAHHRHARAAAGAVTTHAEPDCRLVLLVSPDDDPLPLPDASPRVEVRRLSPLTLGLEAEAWRLATRLEVPRQPWPEPPSRPEPLSDGLQARLMAALLMRQAVLRGPDAVTLLSALSGLPRGSATLITSAGHGQALLRRLVESNPATGAFLTFAPEPVGRLSRGFGGGGYLSVAMAGSMADDPAPLLATPTPEAVAAAFDSVCDHLAPDLRHAPRVLLTAPGVEGAPLRLRLVRAPVASHLGWALSEVAGPPPGRLRVGVLPPHALSAPLLADHAVELSTLVPRLAAALSDLDGVRALRLEVVSTADGLLLLDGALELAVG